MYFRSHIHSQMSDKYVFLLCFLHSMHCILQAPQMLRSQPEVFPLPENSDPSFLLRRPEAPCCRIPLLPLPLYFPHSQTHPHCFRLSFLSCRLSRSVSPLSPGTSSRTLPRYCPQKKQPETQGIWPLFFLSHILLFFLPSHTLREFLTSTVCTCFTAYTQKFR